MRWLIPALLVVAGLSFACGDGEPVLSAGEPCPVTEPNGSTPPGQSLPSENILGNGDLWVGIYPEGKVLFEPGGPGTVEADGSLSMKFWWWRANPADQLEIEGRSLDRDAPPLRADIPDGYDSQYFQATGLIFPTEGCWEVTGRAGDGSLTFVTEVVSLY